MSDTTAHAMILAVMLILPISALAARRLDLPDILKYAAAWIAIFVLGFLVVSSFT